RTVRMPPVRARHIGPPGAMIAQAHRARRLDEHQRARHEKFARRVRIHFGARYAFGERHITGRRDEAAEFRVRDREAIDPESFDARDADRTFLAIEGVRSHLKTAAGDPDHVSPADRAGGRTDRGCADAVRSLAPRTAMCCSVLHGPCLALVSARAVWARSRAAIPAGS